MMILINLFLSHLVMIMSKCINIEDCLVPLELKKIRESRLITLTEVSENTGLSSSAISNLEHNKNVGIKTLITVADYLGYEIYLRKKKPEVIIDI